MSDLLERFLNLMERVFLTIANVLLALMVLGGMVNILVRDVLGQGVVWVFQTTIVFFAWSVFFGMFVVYRRGSDVAVELVVDAFSQSVQKLAKLFVIALTIFVFGTILFQAPRLIELQSIPLETLDIPRYVIAVPLFISCILTILSSIKKLIEIIKPDSAIEQ